jgi:hypothetical protein
VMYLETKLSLPDIFTLYYIILELFKMNKYIHIYIFSQHIIGAITLIVLSLFTQVSLFSCLLVRVCVFARPEFIISHVTFR